VIHALGWHGEVPSPTYTLVQSYDPPDVRVPVWHVDLYRLDSPDDADALGLFETDAALIIEWPERLAGRLPPEALHLTISGSGEAPRLLTSRVPKAWEGRWPPHPPR
jgi:tRNA threonylcarbamoyladenosine biosynthesis protein TsaE